jgi:hypothetical protein
MRKLLFLLGTAVVCVVAVVGTGNTWGVRQEMTKETDNFNGYKNVQEYLDYAELAQKRKILIVGAGRGNNSDKKFYGDNIKDYFLIDIEEKHQPDIALDVTNLSELDDGRGQFDIVIFEFLPDDAGFCFKAINGAMDLLKPGGKLISTAFPIPTFTTQENEWLFSAAIDECRIENEVKSQTFDVGDGMKFTYGEDNLGHNCRFSGYGAIEKKPFDFNLAADYTAFNIQLFIINDLLFKELRGTNVNTYEILREAMLSEDSGKEEAANIVLKILNKNGKNIVRAMYEYNAQETIFDETVENVKFYIRSDSDPILWPKKNINRRIPIMEITRKENVANVTEFLE